MIKFYCECCEESVNVIIEDLMSDELNGDAIWGDIVCNTCKLVIATVTAKEPGTYRFVKVDDTYNEGSKKNYERTV